MQVLVGTVVGLGEEEEAGVTALAGDGTGQALVSMFIMAPDPGLYLVLPQQPVSPTWVRYLLVQSQDTLIPLSDSSSRKR